MTWMDVPFWLLWILSVASAWNDYLTEATICIVGASLVFAINVAVKELKGELE